MCPGLDPSNHFSTHLIEAFETKKLKLILKKWPEKPGFQTIKYHSE